MRVIRWRAWALVGALGAASWGLWVGGARLGAPPVSSWDEATRWYEAVGPATAVAATVRALAIPVALWLLLAAVAQLLTVSRGPAARRLAAVIIPRSLQQCVLGLAGLSLTAGLSVTAPSAGLLGDGGGGVAVMRLVDGPPTASGTATMRPAPGPSSAPAPPAVPVAADAVVVVPGDSLWSIAAAVVADGLATEPRDAEVSAYWRRLVDANRGTLVDPSNPDLIYAGQVLTLPPR